MGSRTDLHNIAEQLRGLAFGTDIDQMIKACAALLQGAVERGAFAGAEYILLRDAIAQDDIRRAVEWVEVNAHKLPVWPFFTPTHSQLNDDVWSSCNMSALASLLEAEADALGKVAPAASADSADTPRLFPGGIPDDIDLTDLVCAIDANDDPDKSWNQIARETLGETKEHHPKSDGKLRKLRKYRKDKKINL